MSLRSNGEVVYDVASESMAAIDATPLPAIETLTIPGWLEGSCLASFGTATVDSADVDAILEYWENLDWRVESPQNPPGWPEVEHVLFVGGAGMGTLALNASDEWQIWWTTWCSEAPG